jgi:hypothetical protein
MISPALVAIALGSQLVVTVADDVPAFDVTFGCHAAAVMTPQGYDACMKDESDARSKLESSWTGFAAADRASCVQDATTGGSPSYVDLLTCLQMAKDVRELPASGKTTGSGR